MLVWGAGAGLFLTGQESGLVETVLLRSGGASPFPPHTKKRIARSCCGAVARLEPSSLPVYWPVSW